MTTFTGNERATSIYHENGQTVCRYHGTAVVRANGTSITLDSGGWLTSTTKKRMNQCANDWNLNFNVFQKNHEWFVTYGGETIPFEDGMKLTVYSDPF